MQILEQGQINYFIIIVTGLGDSFAHRILAPYKLTLKYISENVSQALRNTLTTATPPFICYVVGEHQHLHSSCTISY